MRIEILDEAQEDLTQGFYFYESREPGLGSYFMIASSRTSIPSSSTQEFIKGQCASILIKHVDLVEGYTGSEDSHEA